MADSVTQLRVAGPVGTKRNLAILGDGFAAADQATYNNWVQTTLMDGVFGRDYFFEDASAWNIFRVNLESVDSGISTRIYDELGTPADASDDTITSDVTRNIALGIIFSGSWAHCWLEYGPNSGTLIQNALDAWVPDDSFVLIVLNTTGFGGCGGIADLLGPQSRPARHSSGADNAPLKMEVAKRVLERQRRAMDADRDPAA